MTSKDILRRAVYAQFARFAIDLKPEEPISAIMEAVEVFVDGVIGEDEKGYYPFKITHEQERQMILESHRDSLRFEQRQRAGLDPSEGKK